MGWMWLLRLVRAIYACFISVYLSLTVVLIGGWYLSDADFEEAFGMSKSE